jgi:hypothetical protein
MVIILMGLPDRERPLPGASWPSHLAGNISTLTIFILANVAKMKSGVPLNDEIENPGSNLCNDSFKSGWQ